MTVRGVGVSAAIAVSALYGLIGTGVLSVGESTTDGATDLFAFGMLMGAMYLATAAALWWWHGRIGLALVAGFQLIPLLGYVAAAGLREPPFELWGVLIKAGQLVVLIAAVALASQAGRRALPGTRPSPKEGIA